MLEDAFRQTRVAAKEQKRALIIQAPNTLNIKEELRSAFRYCLQLHDDYYSPDYILKNWAKEPEAWKLACLLKQTLSSETIHKWWTCFSHIEQCLCAQFQDLGTVFLKVAWPALPSSIKHYCIAYQTIPMYTIRRHFFSTSYSNQLLMFRCQWLSIDFMLHIWDRLPHYMRQRCFEQQRVVERIGVAELPMFLASADDVIRRQAINSIAKGEQ